MLRVALIPLRLEPSPVPVYWLCLSVRKKGRSGRKPTAHDGAADHMMMSRHIAARTMRCPSESASPVPPTSPKTTQGLGRGARLGAHVLAGPLRRRVGVGGAPERLALWRAQLLQGRHQHAHVLLELCLWGPPSALVHILPCCIHSASSRSWRAFRHRRSMGAPQSVIVDLRSELAPQQPAWW